MPYERKILELAKCPRCSFSKAEMRLDVVKRQDDRILVYLVCPMCRLSKYAFRTNKKAIKIQSRIDFLQKSLKKLDKESMKARTIRANIADLQQKRRKQETGV